MILSQTTLEIVQKPQSYSFAETIRPLVMRGEGFCEVKIVLQTISGTSFAEGDIITEQYWFNESNLATIEYRELLRSYFEQIFAEQEQTKFALKVTTTIIYGSETHTITFFCYNVCVKNHMEETAFLRQYFLTLQPQTKAVDVLSPERLCYYSERDGGLFAKFYKQDGETAVIKIADLPAKTCTIHNVNFEYIWRKSTIPTAERCGYFDVFAGLDAQTPLTKPQRYIYTPTKDETKYFVFANRCGGYDTIMLEGVKSTANESEYQAAKQNNTLISIDQRNRLQYSHNCPQVPLDWEQWVFEFINSPEIYEYLPTDKRYRPIIITESSQSFNSSQNLNDFSFTYMERQMPEVVETIKREDLNPFTLEPPEISLAVLLIENESVLVRDIDQLQANFTLSVESSSEYEITPTNPADWCVVEKLPTDPDTLTIHCEENDTESDRWSQYTLQNTEGVTAVLMIQQSRNVSENRKYLTDNSGTFIADNAGRKIIVL